MKNKYIFLVISVPFLIAYIYYVFKTPGVIFNNSAPYWEIGRIGIFLFWIAVIYYLRWMPNIINAWSPNNFLIACFPGGGFLFLVIAYTGAWWHPPVGIVSSSSLLSGLFASSSLSYSRAFWVGFFFLFMQ